MRKRRFDLLLFLLAVGGDKDVGLRRELGGKRQALVQHIHKIQVHGQGDAALGADLLRQGFVLHRRRDHTR